MCVCSTTLRAPVPVELLLLLLDCRHFQAVTMCVCVGWCASARLLRNCGVYTESGLRKIKKSARQRRHQFKSVIKRGIVIFQLSGRRHTNANHPLFCPTLVQAARSFVFVLFAFCFASTASVLLPPLYPTMPPSSLRAIFA